MKITKDRLAQLIVSKTGSSSRDAKEYVEEFFELIKESLQDGENVKISGFGRFVINHKNARIGRNPQSGDTIEITERKVLTFKPSQVLRDKLN